MKTKDMRCSFCGKSRELVAKLVAGPGGLFICDQCVEICNDLIKEKDENSYHKNELGELNEIKKCCSRIIEHIDEIIKLRQSD